MNRQVNRILAFGLTFVVATSLSLLFKVARPQLVAPAQPVSHTTPNTSDEIMRVLMPNGVTADDTQLSKFNRNEAINALKDAKRNALGPRAVGISSYWQRCTKTTLQTGQDSLTSWANVINLHTRKRGSVLTTFHPI